MAVVKPFKALRPKPEYAAGVASPPYDVLSAKEARYIVKTQPNSFLRVNKAELEFDDNVDQYSQAVYERGRDNLKMLETTGVMFREDKPCYYLYRLTMGKIRQTGLVALASVEEYDQGIIKKHEHTRPEKVNDRANHIEFLNAQVGPVFLTYRYNEEVAQLFGRIKSADPEVDFVADDGIRHEFWVINSDQDIQQITSAFAKIPYLYIADGHHRSQSASEVCKRRKEANPDHDGTENYNYFLNVIFPDSELHILAYNRVVKDMHGRSLEEILEMAGSAFDISPADTAVDPVELHCFGMYCQGKWYTLKAKADSFDPENPTGSIDAAILQKNFIDPILDIQDPKTDKRIDFVGGIRGTAELVKLVDSGEYALAFSLFPTSIRQLLDVADANTVMPPKSTWFEPKLRSGMAVNLLD